MAEKLTPNGLVVGLIPDENPVEKEPETPAQEAPKASRGGRKPRAASAE